MSRVTSLNRNPLGWLCRDLTNRKIGLQVRVLPANTEKILPIMAEESDMELTCSLDSQRTLPTSAGTRLVDDKDSHQYEHLESLESKNPVLLLHPVVFGLRRKHVWGRLVRATCIRSRHDINILLLPANLGHCIEMTRVCWMADLYVKAFDRFSKLCGEIPCFVTGSVQARSRQLHPSDCIEAQYCSIASRH